jgi:hypothetical protein
MSFTSFYRNMTYRLLTRVIIVLLQSVKITPNPN